MNGVIYRYTSPNGKHYIGQTTDEEKRKREHKSANSSQIFHSAIRKYGFDVFVYTVIHRNIDNFDELNRLEQEEIVKHNSISPHGYNLKSGGRNGILCQESKEKISIRLKGRKLSQETKDKLKIAHTGKKLSQEHKEKMSIAKIGKRHTEESKEKMRRTQKDRLPISGESKEKMRLAKLGKKQSQETIEKRRIKLIGKTGGSRVGRKLSEEAKKNMLKAWIIRKAKKQTQPIQLELNM
jgi:group I intron endonuclease